MTYKHDVSRTGLDPTETLLTLSNVNATTFGLLRELAVDSTVDAQPLYLSHLTVGGATHNVVFVATEADSVYAFDADTGQTLWHVSLLASGETPSDEVDNCGQVVPEIGITSTPVIDRSAGAHGTIFVVAMSKDETENYHQRLHALDVTTGAELLGGPTEITGTYAGPSGTVTFDPEQYEERAALLLSQGVIYTTWTSHCDVPNYTGWVMAYSETTLAQTAVLNVAPSSNNGPAIWMSGDGPAVDSSGYIYFLTANGQFETILDGNGFPDLGDYGNAFMKISTTGGKLAVADYFALDDTLALSDNDLDLGSGGEIVLPDLTDASGTVRHLVVGAGKDGNIYVVDRDNMGKFNASSNYIWQEIDEAQSGCFNGPAYFNGTLYYPDVSGPLRAFPVNDALFATSPSSQTTISFERPGAGLAISANGTANGIVWAFENSDPAVLHAYDASNLAHELYNSNQASSGRDQFGAGNKFIAPAVADGKVFVGTPDAVAVFGLLPN